MSQPPLAATAAPVDLPASPTAVPLRTGKRRGNPDLGLALRCGARTRGGCPCRAPAIHGKLRCRMHGGRSTGPRTAEGMARLRAARTVHGAYGAEMRARNRHDLTALRRGQVGNDALRCGDRLPADLAVRLLQMPLELMPPPWPSGGLTPAEDRAVLRAETAALAPWREAIAQVGAALRADRATSRAGVRRSATQAGVHAPVPSRRNPAGVVGAADSALEVRATEPHAPGLVADAGGVAATPSAAPVPTAPVPTAPVPAAAMPTVAMPNVAMTNVAMPMDAGAHASERAATGGRTGARAAVRVPVPLHRDHPSMEDAADSTPPDRATAPRTPECAANSGGATTTPSTAPAPTTPMPTAPMPAAPMPASPMPASPMPASRMTAHAGAHAPERAAPGARSGARASGHAPVPPHHDPATLEDAAESARPDGVTEPHTAECVADAGGATATSSSAPMRTAPRTVHAEAHAPEHARQVEGGSMTKPLCAPGRAVQSQAEAHAPESPAAGETGTPEAGMNRAARRRLEHFQRRLRGTLAAASVHDRRHR